MFLEDDSLISRKDFLKQGLKTMMGFLAEQVPNIPETEQRQINYLRPPGALAETDFLKACEPFCPSCREVCPRQAIQQDSFGFPFVNPLDAPCVMCTDVPCTTHCPTGALLPLLDPDQIAMGTAVIELTQCTAFQGSGCRTCYDICPLTGKAIQLIEGLPQIVPEACTGCGVCVFDCPTPHAIFIRPDRVGTFSSIVGRTSEETACTMDVATRSEQP